MTDVFDTNVQCEEVFDWLDDRSNTVSHSSYVVPLESPAHDDGIRRLARPTDPATSHKAAASVKQPTIQKLYKAILELCCEKGTTDHDLVEALSYGIDVSTQTTGIGSPSGVRTRRHELSDLGCVYVLGTVLVTAVGKQARLHMKWKTSELGEMVLAELEKDPNQPIQRIVLYYGGIEHVKEVR